MMVSSGHSQGPNPFACLSVTHRDKPSTMYCKYEEALAATAHHPLKIITAQQAQPNLPEGLEGLLQMEEDLHPSGPRWEAL